MAEPEMSAMFPNGIRTLIVDDDTKFVKSATVLLSVLFSVGDITAIHVLKKLTSGDLRGIDAILIHAGKAAACGFDFRAIVEADLRIPVIYLLPLDHQATGDEADEQLGTLEEGTYIITKPLDPDEVRTRLWTKTWVHRQRPVVFSPVAWLEVARLHSGASTVAAVATGAGLYSNDEASSFLQPPYLGREQDGNDELIAGMVSMNTTMAHPPVVPQHVGDASDKAAILEYLFNGDFDDYSAGSPLVAPDDQVLGMAWNVNDLTVMAGGAFGSNNTASFMGPHQDLVAAPNGDQRLALDNNIYGSLMESQDQGPDVAVDGDDDALMEAMLASGQYEDDNLGAAMDGEDEGLLEAMLAFGESEDDNLGAAVDGEDDGLMEAMLASGQQMLASTEYEDDNLGAVVDGDNDGLMEAMLASGMYEDDDLGTATDRDDDGLTAAMIAFDQFEDDNPCTEMDGDDDDGLMAAMLAADQYEDDNALFPIEALLDDLPFAMFDFDDDLDAQLGGAADGDDATGNLLAGGQGGGGMDDGVIGTLEGLDIPFDFLFNNIWE
ncbi:hypothetical protein BAE44_0010356 [Dichanthelium oligosanthes]|uniref:Uncharacterized protein n=1 Tax=Dichanthelium oligosanthes TaxID=888268 RepID=A0A1E5VU36_9POAL|nr:hypothetical protein BAE44_0010356 [Dichanthelium oligosanthes]